MNAPLRQPGAARRRIGAFLFICGVFLAIACALSARWWFGYGTATFVADLGDGTLYLKSVHSSDRAVLGFSGGDNGSFNANTNTSRNWTWTWWHWGNRNDWSGGEAYSIWPLAPIAVTSGLALLIPGFRAARRRRKNQCPQCGYSRAGLTPQTPCPECAHTS